MKHLLRKTLGLTMLLACAGAGYLVCKKYKENAEHYEMQKLAPGCFQCSYYKDGIKYMAIADTEEKALERAKESCAVDDKK